MLKDNIVWTKRNITPEISEIKGTLTLEFPQGFLKRRFSEDALIELEEEIKNRIVHTLWHKLYGQIHMDLQEIYYETKRSGGNVDPGISRVGNENIRNLLKRIENI